MYILPYPDSRTCSCHGDIYSLSTRVWKILTIRGMLHFPVTSPIHHQHHDAATMLCLHWWDHSHRRLHPSPLSLWPCLRLRACHSPACLPPPTPAAHFLEGSCVYYLFKPSQPSTTINPCEYRVFARTPVGAAVSHQDLGATAETATVLEYTASSTESAGCQFQSIGLNAAPQFALVSRTPSVFVTYHTMDLNNKKPWRGNRIFIQRGEWQVHGQINAQVFPL